VLVLFDAVDRLAERCVVDRATHLAAVDLLLLGEYCRTLLPSATLCGKFEDLKLL
jgi:hypothetical protein